MGLPVGQWFAARAREHGAFTVDVADLAEINLPFLDEPNHPRLQQYTKQHTIDWSARVGAADAFAMVVPEYNYGYPATIKNAFDFLHEEWRYKPVGFVSYGGVSAGTRSVQQLKAVVTTLAMLAVTEAVSIPFVRERIGEQGELVANDVMNAAADAMLEALARAAVALEPLRGGSPA